VRVAALYDVHGNLPALEAVLAEVERESVDAIVVGGDVVWGPQPAEALDRLLGLGARARFVRGNCERDVLAPGSERDAWCLERLSEEQRAGLADWPATIELRVDGLGDVLFCHGSPRSDEEDLTEATSEDRLVAALAGVEADVVVCGHTHVQLDRSVGGVRLVNAGSVGLPHEGRPGAFWALLGPDVSLRETGYDVPAAVDRLVATGFPGAAELLNRSLVEPEPRAESIASSERRAAGRG
jgi:putative phosphoesterase